MVKEISGSYESTENTNKYRAPRNKHHSSPESFRKIVASFKKVQRLPLCNDDNRMMKSAKPQLQESLFRSQLLSCEMPLHLFFFQEEFCGIPEESICQITTEEGSTKISVTGQILVKLDFFRKSC